MENLASWYAVQTKKELMTLTLGKLHWRAQTITRDKTS